MTRWYRRYSGTVSDPKIAEAALIAGCSKALVIATWDMILESAAESNSGGSFKATSRNVAATLSDNIETVDKVFGAFETLEMIRDGVVVAWTKRQFQSDSSTERSRKHRASKAKEQDATLQGRCATPPDTETYTDTDTDTEKDNTRSVKNLAREGPTEGCSNHAELKSAFNGATDSMLDLIEAQMGGNCRTEAQNWLATTVAAHGQANVAQAYAIMIESRAKGEIIAKPLACWSKTASSLKDGKKPKIAGNSRAEQGVAFARMLEARQ